jgi:hypothetical protein
MLTIEPSRKQRKVNTAKEAIARKYPQCGQAEGRLDLAEKLFHTSRQAADYRSFDFR